MEKLIRTLVVAVFLTCTVHAQAGLISLKILESPSPFGYFSLASLGVLPFGCPANCDDGSFTLTVPTFGFAGDLYSQVIWSVNGTLEAGVGSGLATSFFNQNLPDSTAPNNLLAPFWTDLNLGAGGNWYVAVLNAGSAQYSVFEWENVPLFGDPTAYTFQIWIENSNIINGHSNIWYVYTDVPVLPFFTTVGVENHDGTIGDSYYYNGVGISPRVGVDLKVVAEFNDLPNPTIPVPTTLALFGLGLAGLGISRRKKV